MVEFKRWLYIHWCGAQRYVRAVIFTLLNAHTLYTSLIALLAVYITSDRVLGIKYKVDTFFVSLGVTFPLVFALQAAFGRREAACKSMANLKANSINYYLMHREWEKPAPADVSGAGDNSRPNAVEAKELLCAFLAAVRKYLVQPNRAEESTSEVLWKDTSFANSWLSMLLHSKVRFSRKSNLATLDDPELVACYGAICRLSILNEKTLKRWGCTKPGEAPAANLLAGLGSLVTEFEMLRTIRDYRTPVMLRYGNKVLVHLVAILLGPYFNSFCSDTKESGEMCYVSYLVAFMFVVTITLLSRIAKDLEIPFDCQGMDDLFYCADAEMRDFASINVGGVDELFPKVAAQPNPGQVDKTLPAATVQVTACCVSV